jgi:hypothetical protein
MSLALHFPVNLRMATELLGSDSILFPCTVSGVHHKPAAAMESSKQESCQWATEKRLSEPFTIA